jgi:hypothetical protein
MSKFETGSPPRDRDEQIALLNLLVNQPEILPYMAPGYLRVDLDNFFDNPGNLVIGDARGVVMFANMGDGNFEVHYMLTSNLRGRERLQRIKEAFTALFTYRDAVAIVGATPRDNHAARMMNRALGGRPIGEKIDSQGRQSIIYILERKTWATLLGA